MEDSQRKGKVWLTAGLMLLVGVASVYIGIVGIAESSAENEAGGNSATAVSEIATNTPRSEPIAKMFPQFNPAEAKVSIDQTAISDAWTDSEFKGCSEVKNDCSR